MRSNLKKRKPGLKLFASEIRRVFRLREASCLGCNVNPVAAAYDPGGAIDSVLTIAVRQDCNTPLPLASSFDFFCPDRARIGHHEPQHHHLG